GEAIIVPKNSPLKSVADLKGKRVAFNKGSNVHYLLVKLLEKANVPYSDIQPVYLTPADARAAFERGAIDAWVIWDPFFAAAEQQLGARVLADGTGVVNNSQYFLASKGYAGVRPDVLNIVLDELKKTDPWAAANPKDVTNILGPQLG
ncbi:transporter substrate-binding domain-containing protein, partial [Francisella tularensis]|uniref:ABC transporter substrate-binding protein n=1 Tax=Francisella tularensis TaxID=263 RepID=UPI001366473A